MGDDIIDMVIFQIDMGYLVTLLACPASKVRHMAWASVHTSRSSIAYASSQGLTLVPNSAQLELFCPPRNPT